MAECGHFTFAADDPDCQRLGMGAAALRYAQLGYAVLPLDRGGKRPHQMLGKGGVHWATRDPGAISWCWTQDRAANVGVATGSASSLVVIDLDIKSETNGIQAFADFLSHSCLQPEDSGLPWPDDVPYALTPSGGMHLWLRTAEPVPNKVGVLPGVDVRGDGGLAVAPPSILLKAPASRPGEAAGVPVPLPYTWRSGCPCSAPAAPAWVSSWLASAPSSSSGSGTSDASQAPALAELMSTGIQVGQRNSTLYRLACSRYRFWQHVPDREQRVIAELGQVWQAGDTSGLPWAEVLTIARSAREFVDDQIRRELALPTGWIERMTG